MDTRTIRVALAAAVCALTGSLMAATEYFVDCTRPDDSGDGLTVATAKRTIQAAVDLTSPAGKDTVTVLPGVYREGSRRSPAYSDDDFRVVITNHCLLRSRDGARKTFIVGEMGPDENRQGAGAVRGIFMNGVSYAVVEGFTITGCATRYAAASGNKHYGAAVVGNWNNFLLGCVVSNNWAYTGAGTHLVNSIGCLIADNHAKENTVGVNAYYFNCVITRNVGSSSPLGYVKSLVNCTCVDNPGTLFNSSSVKIFNSVMTLSPAVGSTGNTEISNCVTDASSTQFKTFGNSACGASRYQHVAPVFGDWRLKSDSPALGRASLADYRRILNTDQKFSVSVDLGWNPQWILDKYELNDFAGNAMAEPLDAGALQGGVAVASGPVDFTLSFCGGGWNVPSGTSYAFSETWPCTISCRMVPADGMPLFHCVSTGVYGNHYHHPTLDGRIVFAMPPAGGSTTITGYASQHVYYVDDGRGDDANSGLDRDHPFQTLQRASDIAAGNYNYVVVAPGVYDKGGSECNGVSNRLQCAGKSIQFVAEGGPDVTFVKGAASPGGLYDGFGPAAVRCVRWYTSHNDAAMRGFTFVDGHTTGAGMTAFNNWLANEQNMGGAVYVNAEAGQVHFLDCVFSNNVALIAAANHCGSYTRCRFIANRPCNPSGSVGRNSTYRFCEFRDNVEQNFTLDNSAQNLYFCSVRGKFAPYQANTYASLFTGMAGVSSANLNVIGSHDFYGNLVNGATVTSGTTGAFANNLTDDARLVDFAGGNLRFLADSPAVGALPAADRPSLLGEATEDLDGHGLHVKDGRLTLGAHQYPVQAVVVEGPKSLVVTGGSTGTNALEAGESLTATAAAKWNNRGFLGWTVNGDELPFESLDYAYTAPDDPTAEVTVISARYARLGTQLYFR